jgi:glycosyltransferase involved in cell wall biosynthesis
MNDKNRVLHIITRCSRLNNIIKVGESLPTKDGKLQVQWHVIFDSTRLKDIDAEILGRLQEEYNAKLYFEFSQGGDYLYPQMNKIIIDNIQEGWIYSLDDDNILHEKLFDNFEALVGFCEAEKSIGIVFNQHVAGKDFTGVDVRYAKPENMKVRSIDLAQFILHRSVFNDFDFKGGYDADGKFIERVYEANPDGFLFIDKILSHYNYLQKPSKAKVPKILYIGEGTPVLESNNPANWESSELEVEYIKDDSNIYNDITRIKPIAIVSAYENPAELTNLWNAPYELRKMWINVDSKDPMAGEKAYQCAMGAMLENDISKLISYFTPIYNTGEKLWMTYESLTKQTYTNWEWVMVNDSSDGGATLKIAQKIAALDPRVKVFDFNPKSGGNIGEVKWRCATLTRGYILAELDHDDYLVPTCTEDLFNASQKHKDIGFFYTDSAEIDQNWNSLKYGPGFAFSYGHYVTENVLGKDFEVAVSSNINPKTIRHIVGVPNHVRAWRRETYFEIGGHCRDLAIADDYELIVRTFLKTKMMRIPRLGYLQFIYDDGNTTNSHNLGRADIQRRVKTIMYHYNDKIKARFEELGKEDWAYNESPNDPLSVASRFGDQEGYVNEIYQL